MNGRITPENITRLNDNEVFVFGSNEGGLHCGGAALQALEFGATYGRAFGLSGRSFAIPTMGPIRRIRRAFISANVGVFLDVAREHPELTFLVTEIGCGIAGYKPKDIAPMFREAVEIDNVYLPRRFWEVLNQTT